MANSPWVNSTSAGSGLFASPQLQTINLTASTSPWSNISIDLGLSDAFKKYQIVESKEDILALATTRKRIDPGCMKYHTLLDEDLQNAVTEEDRVQATIIRDYYQKKFVLWELKETQLTPFRIELKNFVHSDGKKFKESVAPIAWRLPEFYEYDVDFEKLQREYNHQVIGEDFSNETKTLNLVRTFDVKKRAGKKREFWFSDQHNNLVFIPVVSNNPLLGLMDHVAKSPLKISGSYTKAERDGKEYLRIRDMTFL